MDVTLLMVDGLVLLTILGGGVGFAIAEAFYLKACPWCLGFWAGMLIQLFATLLGSGRMSRFATYSVLSICTLVTVATLSGAARNEISGLLPDPRRTLNGLSQNSIWPLKTRTGDGTFVLATRCAPCMEASFLRTVKTLDREHQVFTVLVAPGARVSGDLGWRSLPLTESEVASLKVTATGPPQVATIIQGKVIRFESCSRFIDHEKN